MPQTYHSRLFLKSLQNTASYKKNLLAVWFYFFQKKTCRLTPKFIIFNVYLSDEDMGSVGVPREKIASGGAYTVLQK